MFGYHVVRFVDTAIEVSAETDERLAILAAAKPGGVAIVPTYDHALRSRWHLGDDFASYPWLRDYVGGELFDVTRVDLDRLDRARRTVRGALRAAARAWMFRRRRTGRSRPRHARVT